MPKTTPEHKGRIIRTQMRTTATPQQVWEAWTDPAKLAQWFPDKASGEARVGSLMTLAWNRFPEWSSKVLEAVPGERLVLQGAVAGGESGILEITIERQDGETILKLVNSGFSSAAQWEDEYQGVVSGWEMELSILGYYLENHFGMPRTSFLAMRPAAFEYGRLLPYYLQSDRLAEWLTRSGAIGSTGERFELVLRDGGKVTGRVLTITQREVAMTWEEIHGVLELKAFAMGPGSRVLAVRGCGWNLPAARAAEIENQMGAALERLATQLAALA